MTSFVRCSNHEYFWGAKLPTHMNAPLYGGLASYCPACGHAACLYPHSTKVGRFLRNQPVCIGTFDVKNVFARVALYCVSCFPSGMRSTSIFLQHPCTGTCPSRIHPHLPVNCPKLKAQYIPHILIRHICCIVCNYSLSRMSRTTTTTARRHSAEVLLRGAMKNTVPHVIGEIEINHRTAYNAAVCLFPFLELTKSTLVHGYLTLACTLSSNGSRVGVTTNARRLERAAAASTPSSARGKRRITPTAVSAQPTAKAVDAGKDTTDPLLLRAARGEVRLPCVWLSGCLWRLRLA